MAQYILLNTESLESLLKTFLSDGDWTAFVAAVSNLLYSDNTGGVFLLTFGPAPLVPSALIVRVDECGCLYKLFRDNWELIRRAILAANPNFRAVLGVEDLGCDCK